MSYGREGGGESWRGREKPEGVESGMGSDDDELSSDDLSKTAVAREARHENSAGES